MHLSLRYWLLLLTALALSALAQAQSGNLSGATDTAPKSSTPNSLAPLAKRLMPAVVNIQTQKSVSLGMPGFGEDSPLNEFNDLFGGGGGGTRRESGQGSGFFISNDGYIVTNNHVIEGADQINITLADGRQFGADLIGRDAETDIAVIKAQAPENFDFVSFGDSELAEVGDSVVAIGNPFGFGGSVTSGIISARNRDINAGRYDNFIQTDAAINRGNSGGPLFNLDGEVIGVNTAIISNTGGSIGLGFSVPSNMAEKIAQDLIADGVVKRASLGVSVQSASAALVAAYGGDADGGVVITRINEDGPADKAGLLVGDLILSFAAKPVTSLRSFVTQVADMPIETPLAVELIRDGETLTETVILALMGAEDSNATSTEENTNSDNTTSTRQSFASLGLDIAEITNADRRRYGIPRDIEGVIVRAVAESGASFGQLRRGDVITEIGYTVVFGDDDARDTLETEIRAAKDMKRPLLLRVNRRGLALFVPITLD